MNKNDSKRLFTASGTPRTGSSEEVGIVGYKGIGVTVDWPTGTTAGVLAVETAPYAGYAGAWVNVGTITYASGAPKAQALAAAIAANVMRCRWTTDHAGGAAAAGVYLNLQV